MRNVWVCLASLAAASGCLASREGGNSEVDEIYDLELEIAMARCACDTDRFADDDCEQADFITEQIRDCVGQVVAKHRAEFAPLIMCTRGELQQERDCLMANACGTDPWFACSEIDADCDDSVAERYEGELETCVRGSSSTDDSQNQPATPPQLTVGPTCGNDMLDAGEACDVLGDVPYFAQGGTCATATQGMLPSGTLGCEVSSCTLDISRCTQ